MTHRSESSLSRCRHRQRACKFISDVAMSQLMQVIKVRASQTGCSVPVRDAPGALPDGQSCWDAAAVVAVSCQNVTLISFSFRA